MKPQPSLNPEPAIVHTQLEQLYQLMDVDFEQVGDEQYVLLRMREVCEERNQLKLRNVMLQRDIEKLTHYLDQLQYDTMAIERSYAWRIGFKAVTTLKKLTGRTGARHAFTSVHRTLTLYHHWKKSRD